MIEQQKANKAKIWGYVTGLMVVAIVVAWKFVVR
jgi:hypothetical protein